jgi:hypothetical protein
MVIMIDCRRNEIRTKAIQTNFSRQKNRTSLIIKYIAVEMELEQKLSKQILVATKIEFVMMITIDCRRNGIRAKVIRTNFGHQKNRTSLIIKYIAVEMELEQKLFEQILVARKIERV